MIEPGNESSSGPTFPFTVTTSSVEEKAVPFVYTNDNYVNLERLTHSLVQAVYADILAREHAKNILKHHLKIMGLDVPKS